jgi:DNA-binding transcriptional MerR regulator
MAEPGLHIPRKQAGYIRKEASEITKIPARTIQYYTDRGFVTPDVAAPTGRGTTRRYCRKNLVELSFIKELSAHGYTLEKVEIIMRVVRRSLDKYWNKSNDMPWETDLLLILLRPGTKHIEVELCREEEMDFPLLIRQSSFSVLRLQGVILRVLKVAIGSSKYEAWLELQGSTKYTGYSEEEVARILDE